MANRNAQRITAPYTTQPTKSVPPKATMRAVAMTMNPRPQSTSMTVTRPLETVRNQAKTAIVNTAMASHASGSMPPGF